MSSFGEENIKKLLDQENFEYIEEHSFSDLKAKYVLRYDFYIPKYRCLIEVDGEQHFSKNEFFSQDLELIKARDIRKNQYCIENGYKLIRIPYSKLNIITSKYLANKITKNVYGKVWNLTNLIKC